MFKIATWNVNSLKMRLEQVIDWLNEAEVDVLALQETKTIDALFPRDVFFEHGYDVVFSGQKTYNGVAIISRLPITDVVTDIEGYEDPQRRILAATINNVRYINLYVPNGAAVDSDKYTYKLTWLEHVTAFVRQQLQEYPALVVCGDFNIAPTDDDVYDPKEWFDSVLVSPPERKAFERLLRLGLWDSFRVFSPKEQAYTWWDYRAAAFRRNRGLRIDHLLISDVLKQNCIACVIDKQPRKAERPSDHTPIWIALSENVKE